MKTKRTLTLWVMLTVGLFLMPGCSSTPKMDGPAMPEWVYKGSGAFDVEKGRVFYGVGIAAGIRNKTLLFSTADSRALAEVAKTLETYAAVLAKDYMASATAGDISASSEKQRVEQALKTFSNTTLRGATIVNHWQNPEDKTLYSLCELDLFAFKEALYNDKELDAKVRDYVSENAEKMHAELKKREDKQ